MPDAKPSKNGKHAQTELGVRACFDRFDQRFQALHHRKPIFSGGKDGTLFKKLIGIDGVTATLQLIDEFFDATDAFVVMSDYSVGAFYMAAQRLRIRGTRVTDRRLAENADAAARAARGE